MGFFDNQERTSGLQAVKATPPQPAQEIEMVVEYFDKTVENFSVTASANPPFSINPRWIKKVSYQTK